MMRPLLLFFWLLIASVNALAQVYVYPRRAEQSRVRYFSPDWKKAVISVSTSQGPVPIHLYFYESERKAAELAVPMVEHSVRYLAERFNYVPQKPIPYFLYNSYLEFLETNLFPVQVGTLGVTSPEDFKLALPFFGDFEFFDRVSTHELVHEFMSQKLFTISQGTMAGLSVLPLWFIEGMAEYYTMNGLDAETEIMLRDFLTHPNSETGYVQTDFFHEGPYSFFGIYKYGQVRCAFLEETFGGGTIQKILARAHESEPGGFKQLVAKITGITPEEISRRFETWIKRRSFHVYSAARQHPSDFHLVKNVKGQPQYLASSPSGKHVSYLTVLPDSGEVRIYLFSAEFTEKLTEIVSDGRPGVEALHITSGQNFDLTDNAIVYVAQSQGHDVLYWRDFEDRGDGQIRLKDLIRYEVGRQGILAIESPTISPDQKQIAFVGYSKDGQKDIFVLTRGEGDEFALKRRTHTLAAERGIDWSHKGIIYTSDVATKGQFNLFLISSEGETPPVQLTHRRESVLQPFTNSEGRVFFTAFESAKLNIFELQDGRTLQKTDVDTAFFEPAAGVEGLWALLYYKGQKVPAFIPQSKLLNETKISEKSEARPFEVSRSDLSEAQDYSAAQFSSWEFGRTIGFFGAGPGGASGQIVTSMHDRLRNHIVGVNLLFLGPWSLTDGQMIYVNQERRIIWGAGLFREITLRANPSRDRRYRYLSFESYSGLLGSVRYPFSRFFYIQGNLAVGELDPFVTEDHEKFLKSVSTPYGNLYEEWLSQERGPRSLVQSSISLGYNSMRFHRTTGPIAGSSILLQGFLDTFPQTGESGSRLRLDLERFYPLAPPTNFLLRAGGGATLREAQSQEFYLSPLYTLRPVPSGDLDRLVGNHFFFSTAELQFPLRSIVRFLFFDPEGIAGFDFGGVGDTGDQMWRNRALGFVTGFNFNISPLAIRLHFSKPFAAGESGLPNNGDWITHFALTYAYD